MYAHYLIRCPDSNRRLRPMGSNLTMAATRPVSAGSSAGPLWRGVRDDLLARLEAGEFSESFPGEHELASDYQVSRHTVRAALRELREQGLITAARGQRSRPGGPTHIEQPVGALYSLFASVEAAGLEQRSIVRSLDIRADAHIAERLGLESSAPLLHLERVRLAGGEPLAHDQVWLPAADTRALLATDFSHTALYTELTDRCGIRLTGGEERIRAVIPTSHERHLLEMSADVAAFAIERLGVVSGRPVEWRVSLVRGDRFSALARFDSRTGYRLSLGALTANLPLWSTP
jgi:GntR family transcriptional regulator